MHILEIWNSRKDLNRARLELSFFFSRLKLRVHDALLFSTQMCVMYKINIGGEI